MTGDAETAMARSIRDSLETGEETTGVLRVDDRVMARISDGIYRHPVSALRELVANAYDADARLVEIRTDRPRFRTIEVHDDGRGMSVETLVRMVHHIGGSAKRTTEGARLGLTSETDPLRSPGGRELIGKIGIGLFAVAQLTRTFQIITKARRSDHRLIADVRLSTYSEDALAQESSSDDRVMTGTFTIVAAPAPDPNSHGTSIVLRGVQPAAIDLLRSQAMWDRMDGQDEGEPAASRLSPPAYHIGRLEPGSTDRYIVDPRLPWDNEDTQSARFQAMYDAVVNELGNVPKSGLDNTFDSYLASLWQLGLQLPVGYIDGIHPFDREPPMLPRVFELSNSAKGQATEIAPAEGRSVRDALGLHAPYRDASDDFDVLVDDVALRRPVSFERLPGARDDDDLRRPLLFVGRYEAPLASLPERMTGGGRFSFEAYFLWTPKVVPRDHAGVLVRIAGASGTLYDRTFLGYQIRENQRLSQTTAEVFVERGLDAALNIDRESFNFGHPHAKILTGWVHRALRQVTNTQKRVAKAKRDQDRAARADEGRDALERLVYERLEQVTDADPVAVVFEPDEPRRPPEMGVDPGDPAAITVSASSVEPALPQGSGVNQRAAQDRRRQQMRGIIQVLDAYGLLDGLPRVTRDRLVADIASIVGFDR